MNRKLRRRLIKAGATVEKLHGGHIKIHKPGHQPVFVASTSKAERAHKNMLATLRREGYLEDSK